MLDDAARHIPPAQPPQIYRDRLCGVYVSQQLLRGFSPSAVQERRGCLYAGVDCWCVKHCLCKDLNGLLRIGTRQSPDTVAVLT